MWFGAGDFASNSLMQDVVFSLSITPEAYLQYYRGTAKAVIVQAEDGRRVQFPAESLKPYIQADGIHGRFRLVFDKNHKFQKLEKLSG